VTRKRHWRTYGNNYPLPTGAEALDEPFGAFPSWFMRVTCDRCGKVQIFSETNMKRGDMRLRAILDRCARLCWPAAERSDNARRAVHISYSAGASTLEDRVTITREGTIQ
jgi:hypothetical protein